MSVTPVKVGATEGETTEIQSGVEPGNLVVVDGADKLREGSKIELIDPQRAVAIGESAARARRGPTRRPGGQRRTGTPFQGRRLIRARVARRR